jgi:predicted RNase H-like nuclease (RuvC/YqgF family)
MNMSDTKDFKSPTRKLVKFFQRSRDQWKAKSAEAKTTVKRQKNRIRYLEASKEKWKRKANELERELTRMKANTTVDSAPQKKTMTYPRRPRG